MNAWCRIGGSVVHRLRRSVSTLSAVILACCTVIGIAFFFVERPTLLNVVLPMIVYSIIGQPITMPWMMVQGVALVVACMMAFAGPAYVVVWMFRRIVPNYVVLILIASWFLCFLYLFMVGPEIVYYSLNKSIQNEHLDRYRRANFYQEIAIELRAKKNV